MPFIPNESFGVNLVRNTPHGEQHAKWHMDLCRAIDMTKLAVVMNEMVKARHLSRLQADAFEAQAGGLLATMLSECARSFIGSPSQSACERVRTFGVCAPVPEEECPGHIASDRDPKTCGRCGTHIDSLRPTPAGST